MLCVSKLTQCKAFIDAVAYDLLKNSQILRTLLPFHRAITIIALFRELPTEIFSI